MVDLKSSNDHLASPESWLVRFAAGGQSGGTPGIGPPEVGTVATDAGCGQVGAAFFGRAASGRFRLCGVVDELGGQQRQLPGQVKHTSHRT